MNGFDVCCCLRASLPPRQGLSNRACGCQFSLAGCAAQRPSPALESVPSLTCTARPTSRLQHQREPDQAKVSKQASSRGREHFASGHRRAIAAGNAATSFLANMNHPIMARICRSGACERCVQSTASRCLAYFSRCDTAPATRCHRRRTGPVRKRRRGARSPLHARVQSLRS